MDNQPKNQEPTFKDSATLDFSSDSMDGGVVDFASLIQKEEVPRETSVDTKEPIDLEVGEEVADESTEANEDKETIADNLKLTKDDIDEVPKTTSGSVNYKKLFTDILENNGWDSVEEIETEEGTIKFDELDVTEEVFKDLLAAKREEENAKLLEGKIETKGVSDFTKQLIEIEKSGGNPKKVLDMYEQIQAPLDTYDLTKEEDQQAVYMMRLQAQGMDDKTAIKVLNASIVAGTLAEDAEESDKMLRDAFKAQVDNYQVQVEEAKVQRQENLKVYKTALKDNLSAFDLSDTFKKRVIDAATKPDENGVFQADTMYNELRKDPQAFTEMALYLTDREEFIKQITKGEVKKEQVKTFTKLKLTNKARGGHPNASMQTDTKTKDIPIPFI